MKSKFLKALCGLAMILAPLAVSAQSADDEAKILVLTFTDESVVEFQLDDKPELAFSDGLLKVTSASASTDYQLDSVKEFHFSATSGVQQVAKDYLQFAYTDGATVSVKGSKAQAASLYNTQGVLVKRAAVTDGEVTMSVADCAPGVYVFALENEHSYKIVKE